MEEASQKAPINPKITKMIPKITEVFLKLLEDSKTSVSYYSDSFCFSTNISFR